MTGKVSAEMRQAIELIRQGKTAYEAAKVTGVTRGAISRSKLYRELIEKTGVTKNAKKNS